MEGGGSSDLPVRVPDDDQPEGRGSEPAASEDPGTLESSTLLPKRCGASRGGLTLTPTARLSWDPALGQALRHR